MITINNRLLEIKSRMTPVQFMVFIYGIPMEKVNVKELSRLTNIPDLEVIKALDDLTGIGFFWQGQMSSKFIGVVQTRGRMKQKATKTKKAPEGFSEILNLYDKGYMAFMGVNSGLTKIDWQDPAVRSCLIKIINRINEKYFDLSEEKYGSGKEPTVDQTISFFKALFNFIAQDGFWSKNIHPIRLSKNFDTIVEAMVLQNRK